MCKPGLFGVMVVAPGCGVSSAVPELAILNSCVRPK